MKTKSEKSYAVSVCLSAIFGIVGIQHFYLGRYFLGLTDLALSILTVYCFVTGQWLYALFFFAVDFSHSLVTTILLLIGSFQDGQGHVVCYPGQVLNKH